MSKRRDQSLGGLAVIALLVVLVFAADHPAAQQPQPSVAAPEQGFVPVKDLPVQEQLPAAPLVMTAYAVAWVAIFVYLWSLWRRLSRVEGEIASVSRRIEAGARR